VAPTRLDWVWGGRPPDPALSGGSASARAVEWACRSSPGHAQTAATLSGGGGAKSPSLHVLLTFGGFSATRHGVLHTASADARQGSVAGGPAKRVGGDGSRDQFAKPLTTSETLVTVVV